MVCINTLNSLPLTRAENLQEIDKLSYFYDIYRYLCYNAHYTTTICTYDQRVVTGGCGYT